MTHGNRRIAAWSLALLAGMSSGPVTAAGGPPPFVMFSTSRFGDPAERDAVGDALRESLTPADYLSVGAARSFPDVAQRIDRRHVYTLPPNLRALERRSANCGPQAGLVVYDGEHWQDTPADEQADMPGAVARGKALVRSTGCDYGVAPDGIFIGLVRKACTFDRTAAIHRRIDWDGIALFNIQAQRLLSDDCAARGGFDAYVAAVSEIAREVRERSPATKVSAQLSFRYTPPDRMIAAVARLRGTVDGFYVAYPKNVGPPCTYCSADHLAEVLRAIRGKRAPAS